MASEERIVRNCIDAWTGATSTQTWIRVYTVRDGRIARIDPHGDRNAVLARSPDLEPGA
jgi:hypothetical protein